MIRRITGLAFQHDGPTFRVRSIMSDGSISGRSCPLEPSPLRKLPKGYIRRAGEGVYDVPDCQGWVLAVGRTSVVWLLRQMLPKERAAEANPYLARDFLERPALLALPSKDNPQFGVARFLPDGWTGSVCDPDLLVRREDE